MNERCVSVFFDANGSEASYFGSRDVWHPKPEVGPWYDNGVSIRIETDDCATTTHIRLDLDRATAIELMNALRRQIQSTR
jgi:hypothetical protein